MPKQLAKVRQDYIRYANCWEDADLLLEGLKPRIGARVLSIGSAGDNSFSFLAHEPELVVAVDINPIQLKLTELKKAAIKVLEHSEFLEFIGFSESKNRLELFTKVLSELSSETADFWKKRTDEIEKGLIFAGKFERYFNAFAYKILPLIHSNTFVAIYYFLY